METTAATATARSGNDSGGDNNDDNFCDRQGDLLAFII